MREGMICTIKPSDFDTFERLNMALVKSTKRDRWQAWREAWAEFPEFKRKEAANVD